MQVKEVTKVKKLLKKHSTDVEATEEVKEEVKEAPAIEVDEENPYLNADEAKALAEQVESEEEKSKEISIKKMEAVVACVQNEFNLSDGDYVVNAFADKGNKSQISLSNSDFDITITIKDNEKFGIL